MASVKNSAHQQGLTPSDFRPTYSNTPERLELGAGVITSSAAIADDLSLSDAIRQQVSSGWFDTDHALKFAAGQRVAFKVNAKGQSL